MEKLLASQDKKFTTLSRGQQVEGEIVSITDKEVILDVGAKSEGILPKKELTDAQIKDLNLGQKIKLYVSLPENEHGQVVLSSYLHTKSVGPSTGRGRGINWNKFIQAQNQKSKLQGRVLEINKGGLIVESDRTRGFLPNSQVGFELLSKVGKNMEELIGQNLSVSVIEIDKDQNRLIFSQRGQVSDDVKSKLSNFEKEQKVKGKIVAILPFGLVVDIDGVEGLVFISDVSWEKVEDLSKEYSVGDETEVMVLGSDQELGRLNLSIKELTEDPFVKLVEKYPADEVVKGEITGVSEAGVSVRLQDGIEGLLAAPKMGVASYEVGKSITLLVDSVDQKRRRINLAPFVTSTEGLIYK